MRRTESWMIPGTDDRLERPSLAVALKARWKARNGPPTEDDAPPVTTFGGHKAALVPGQLDIDGRVHVPAERSSTMRRDAR